MTMSARVTNLTDKDLVFPASLWLNNTIESAREITLSAGATTFFFFVVEKPVGTYNVRVDRLLGQFTVAPIPTPVTPTPVTPTPVTAVRRLPGLVDHRAGVHRGSSPDCWGWNPLVQSLTASESVRRVNVGLRRIP